jgi:hypothetical protein
MGEARLAALLARQETMADSTAVWPVAKARGYSGAAFSGGLSAEFQHLAAKRVRLIDFKAHMKTMQEAHVKAISRTRYGYDSDDDDEPEAFDADDFDAEF